MHGETGLQQALAATAVRQNTPDCHMGPELSNDCRNTSALSIVSMPVQFLCLALCGATCSPQLASK